MVACRRLIFLLAGFVGMMDVAYAGSIEIPPIPQEGASAGPAVPVVNVSTGPETMKPDTKSDPVGKESTPVKKNPFSKPEGKKNPPASESKKKESKKKEIKGMPKDATLPARPHPAPSQGRAQFAPKPSPRPLGEIPEGIATFAEKKDDETKTVPPKPVLAQIRPTRIYSSQETHEVAASSVHENIFMMPKDVLKVFSSRKISVEIRGPVVIVRVPQTAGRNVDLQILTEDYHVETFLLKMDARLPSQKFIVLPPEESEDEEDPLRTPVVARKKGGSYGGAIDTLIAIANGKEPKGFVKKPGDGKVREFRGLRIVHVGSFVRHDAEFAILMITNDTGSDFPQLNEWSLHNERVLGSVENARSVEYMSLDKHSLKPGESTLMYVVMNHRRGRSYE